jgi:Holliday junction resolvasome RuvABC endonuclease subunit
MIVGLDISYTSTGVALFMDIDEIETRRIAPAEPIRSRHLAAIFDELGAMWQEVRPDLIVIEEPFISAYGSTLEKILGAHGVALASMAFHGIDAPILYVHPTTLKMLATGNGQTAKEKMKDCIELVTGKFLQHDEADATALAIVGSVVADCCADTEQSYRDIKTNEMEDAIWQAFGLSREGIENERKRKERIQRKNYKARKREERKAAKEMR